MLIYLSGAIEYAPGGGRAWRASMTRILQGCGYEVYDPALDARKNLTEEELLNFRSWKATSLSRYQQVLRKIIDYDLNLIQARADALLVYWDQFAARGAGTHGELTVAYRLGIPVYLVLGMPMDGVSGWILGCATQVFHNFTEVEHFLRANAVPLCATASPSVHSTDASRER